MFDQVTGLLTDGETAFGSQAEIDVDLAGVQRADSAGLALLLEWALTARAAGRTVRYRNMPAALASLAGISEVSTLLGSPDGS
jgi:phospholipid transport system transporter-binding protein